MWLIAGTMAYNTEQFDKIAVKGNDLVCYINGAEVILKHFAFSDDARELFHMILNNIELGNKKYFL